MIKYTLTQSGNTLEAQFDAYMKHAGNTIERVLSDAQLPLVQAVSEYPRPAVHPFQFATPKSRRYYFWMISQGMVNTDGRRYVRSGGYRNSWSTSVTKGKGAYTLSLMTSWKASTYVGGAMTFDQALMARPQVPGHRVTGWQLVARKTDAQFSNIIEQMRQALNSEGIS